MVTARFPLSLLAVAGLLCFTIGCASANTKDTAARDKITSDVGRYSPPPIQNAERPRVAVPPFKEVQVGGGLRNVHNLNALAADQMTTLLDQTGRFDVVERAQVEQLLDEQNMEGIVRPDQMAKAGQVLGVDYLLIGRVTNFRVKQDTTKHGFNAGGIAAVIPGGTRYGAGQTGFDKKNTRIVTECGVDIRLVDPTNGRIAASQMGEFNRTDSADALGITILGVGTTANADVNIEADDAGRIMRLAFDDALKQMLPKIDRELASRARSGKKPAQAVKQGPAVTQSHVEDSDTSAGGSQKSNSAAQGGAAATDPGGGDTGATAPASDQKFCSNCGAKVASAAKFCPKCGAKME